MSLGVGGIWHPVKKTHLDEHPQPRGQRGPRNAKVPRELTEPPHPEERLTQDKQRPAFTD
ncbi:Uncharacterised protein [Mycobacterium tuberculosis]|nr:Uncharacterised protein [Mycobacterium tuberculosis]